MAATKKASAQAVGRAFAELARNEPAIHAVWVSEHPEIHSRLVVDPIDLDKQRTLYRLLAPLSDQFAHVDAPLHGLNPREHRGDVHRAVPRFAEQSPFRAG